jgi:hypothetical protein
LVEENKKVIEFFNFLYSDNKNLIQENKKLKEILNQKKHHERI